MTKGERIEKVHVANGSICTTRDLVNCPQAPRGTGFQEDASVLPLTLKASEKLGP